jgi:hypothetical protein
VEFLMATDEHAPAWKRLVDMNALATAILWDIVELLKVCPAKNLGELRQDWESEGTRLLQTERKAVSEDSEQ